MYELKPIPQITVNHCKNLEQMKRAVIFAELFICECNRKYYYATYDDNGEQYYVRVTRSGNLIVEKI